MRNIKYAEIRFTLKRALRGRAGKRRFTVAAVVFRLSFFFFFFSSFNFLPSHLFATNIRGELEGEVAREGEKERQHYLAYFDIAVRDQRDPFALRLRFTIDSGSRGGDRERPDY